jgi:hypothetical protein
MQSEKRFTCLKATDTGWKSSDGSVIATKTDEGLDIIDNRDRYEKVQFPLQSKYASLSQFTDRLDRINAGIASHTPEMGTGNIIKMKYIPAPLPGYKNPFPLARLGVGDKLIIPYARIMDEKRQIAVAIKRHRVKYPDKLFSIELDGDYIVTRVE